MVVRRHADIGSGGVVLSRTACTWDQPSPVSRVATPLGNPARTAEDLVAFASKTPDLKGAALTSPLSVQLDKGSILLSRTGTGVSMKIQSKDCASGGIFQTAPRTRPGARPSSSASRSRCRPRAASRRRCPPRNGSRGCVLASHAHMSAREAHAVIIRSGPGRVLCRGAGVVPCPRRPCAGILTAVLTPPPRTSATVGRTKKAPRLRGFSMRRRGLEPPRAIQPTGPQLCPQ